MLLCRAADLPACCELHSKGSWSWLQELLLGCPTRCSCCGSCVSLVVVCRSKLQVGGAASDAGGAAWTSSPGGQAVLPLIPAGAGPATAAWAGQAGSGMLAANCRSEPGWLAQACGAAVAARARRLRLPSVAGAAAAVLRGVPGWELAAEVQCEGWNQLLCPDRRNCCCCCPLPKRGEEGRDSVVSSAPLAVPSSMNPLMLRTSAGTVSRDQVGQWCVCSRNNVGASSTKQAVGSPAFMDGKAAS